MEVAVSRDSATALQSGGRVRLRLKKNVPKATVPGGSPLVRLAPGFKQTAITS